MLVHHLNKYEVLTPIESKMVYATFLFPSSADELHGSDCLLQRFFQCCLGIRVRQPVPLRACYDTRTFLKR